MLLRWMDVFFFQFSFECFFGNTCFGMAEEGCDNGVVEMDENEMNAREQMTEASVVAVESKRCVKKRFRPPFVGALVVVYKKIFSLIRQAFKTVFHLGTLEPGKLPGESIVKEMIANTRIWLIDQMGKNFPRSKGNFLLKCWKKLEPLFLNLICRDRRRNAVSLSLLGGEVMENGSDVSRVVADALPEDVFYVDSSV